MPADLARELEHLEQRLLDPAVRCDPAKLRDLLTEDFVEFGGSGRVFDLPAILEDLAAEPEISQAVISSFRVVVEAADLAVVSYLVSVTREFGIPPRRSLRSSVWVRVGGRWRMRFHQGTRQLDGSQ